LPASVSALGGPGQTSTLPFSAPALKPDGRTHPRIEPLG